MSKITAARKSTHLTSTELKTRQRVPLRYISNNASRQPIARRQQPTINIKEPIKPFHHLELEIGDPTDPQDIVEYENIIYRTMRQQELAAKKHIFRQTEITLKDRNLLIDAMCRFHFKLGSTTNTFYRFIGVLDRYLSVVNVPKRRLHLVGCAALFIASKIEDIKPALADDLIQLSSYSFTANELFSYEVKIINAIGFDTTFPTPLFFLTHFMRINGQTKTTFLYSRYILEICQTSEAFFNVKGSLMACLAVMLCRILEGKTKWSPELAGYTQYSEEELLPYAEKVNAILQEEDRPETAFMRRKYGSNIFLYVAHLDIPSLK